MKNVKAIFRLIGLYFRLNLSSAMEYRGSFLLQAFGMALSNGSFVFFWWIAFQQIKGTIGGYDFRDVMFIWAAHRQLITSHILFANMNAITRLIVRRAGYLSCPAKGYINQSFVCQDIAKRLGGSGIRFYTDGFNPWKGCGSLGNVFAGHCYRRAAHDGYQRVGPYVYLLLRRCFGGR